MFSTLSLATVAGQALLLILAITATIVVVTCLLRNSMKRHKTFQSTCKKLWVHTSRTSIGFSSSSFNSTEDGFDSCSSNTDESTQQREQRETDCDVIFPYLTFSQNKKCGNDEKEMQQGGNTVLPTIQIEQQEDGEHLDDVIGEVHMQGTGSSELDKESNTDTEDQQNIKPEDLDSIEVIYVEVGSFSHKKVAKGTEGEDYDSLTQTSEESVALTAQAGEYDEIVTETDQLRNDVEDAEIYDEIVNRSAARKGLYSRLKENTEQQQTFQSSRVQKTQDLELIEEMYVNVASHATIQHPQKCAAVTPEGKECDYIEFLHCRVKKPNHIEDVEEIYDVVVTKMATRKDFAMSSRVESYSVPAPYEVAMSSNKAYVPSESVSGDEIIMKTVKPRNDVEDAEIYDDIVIPSSVVKENTEQQHTSQSYKLQEPQDLESIEENVYVASHAQEDLAETTASRPTHSEDVILQLPQECAAVRPQGSEYDYIESLHRRIKKPKNIKDVEEMYDVVVNQLATRKNSETSSSIQPYSVPAPYEVAMSNNKAYALSESVPVSKNEAYGASEGGKIKGNTYDTVK